MYWFVFIMPPYTLDASKSYTLDHRVYYDQNIPGSHDTETNERCQEIKDPFWTHFRTFIYLFFYTS